MYIQVGKKNESMTWQKLNFEKFDENYNLHFIFVINIVYGKIIVNLKAYSVKIIDNNCWL